MGGQSTDLNQHDGPPDENPINGKVWVVPSAPPPQRDDTASIRRGAINLALLFLAAAVSLAAALRPDTPITDQSPPAGTSPTAPTDRVPDLGWATQPIDQPAAVPAADWVGWDDLPAGRCAWLPPTLLQRLRPVSSPVDDGRACRIRVVGNNYLRIRWGRVDQPMWWDPLHKEHGATVGGLQARVFELVMNRARYPGACQVSVHTRGLSDFAVMAWHDRHSGMTSRSLCVFSQHAAELVARSRVIATGGASWPATPQTPSTAALDSVSPCHLLTAAVDNYVTNAKPDRVGTELSGRRCTYIAATTRVTALVTNGRGLAHFPTLAGAIVADLPIGPLAARTERFLVGCAATTEILPGRILRIQYTQPEAGSRSCGVATLFLTRAIQDLLNRTMR